MQSAGCFPQHMLSVDCSSQPVPVWCMHTGWLAPSTHAKVCVRIDPPTGVWLRTVTHLDQIQLSPCRIWLWRGVYSSVIEPKLLRLRCLLYVATEWLAQTTERGCITGTSVPPIWRRILRAAAEAACSRRFRLGISQSGGHMLNASQ